MPDIATVATSQHAGHDSCGPTRGASGQAKVTVNGSPVMCVGDTFIPHGPCGDPYNHPVHTPTISQGSSIVDVDGKPVAFVGCQVACPLPNSITSGDSLVDIAH